MTIELGNFSQAAQSLMGEYKAAVQRLETQKTEFEKKAYITQGNAEKKLKVKEPVMAALKWLAQREIDVKKAAEATVLKAYGRPSTDGAAGVEAEITSLAETKEGLINQIPAEEAKNSAGRGLMKWVKWQTVADIPALKAQLLQTTNEIARLSGILHEVHAAKDNAMADLEKTKRYKDAIEDEAKWNQENGEASQLQRILAAKDKALEGVKRCEEGIEQARAGVEDTLKQGVTQLIGVEKQSSQASENREINGLTKGIITFLGKELEAFKTPAETDGELDYNIQRAVAHEPQIQALIRQREVFSTKLTEAAKVQQEKDEQLNVRMQRWEADVGVREAALPTLKGGSDVIGKQAIDLLRAKIKEAGALRAIKDPLDFNQRFDQFVFPDAELAELDGQKGLLQMQWDKLVADDKGGRQTLMDEKLANTAIAARADRAQNPALVAGCLEIQELVKARGAAIDQALLISDQRAFLTQLDLLNAVSNRTKVALDEAVQTNETLYTAWSVKEDACIAEVRDQLGPRLEALLQEIQTLEARRGVQPPELQQLHTELLEGMRQELTGLQRVITLGDHEEFDSNKEALGKLTEAKCVLESQFKAAVEERAAKHASFQSELAFVQARKDSLMAAAKIDIETVRESNLAEDQEVVENAKAPDVSAPVAAVAAPKEGLFKRILFAPLRLIKAVMWTLPVAVVRTVILAPARSLFRLIFKE